jgi:hypothetical protein
MSSSWVPIARRSEGQTKRARVSHGIVWVQGSRLLGLYGPVYESGLDLYRANPDATW